MQLSRRSSILVALVFMGCTTGTPRMNPADDAGATRSDGATATDCDPSVDSDGDGIADWAETQGDIDEDGTPNHLDDDSDGDGLLDREEHVSSTPCERPDPDADGIPNWHDTDSDNDGLLDSEEREANTNPYERDSDSDGVTDFGEVHGTATDPNDPDSTIDPNDFFVVLPYEGERVSRTLRFGTGIRQADVYFLINSASTMAPAIRNVQASLTHISNELRSRIPDLELGVGHFQDFPFSNECTIGDPPECFERGGTYGSPTSLPYVHIQDVTSNITEVEATLSELRVGDGGESHVEALYQTATGEGGSWSFVSGQSHTIAPRACPANRYGYPCFRRGALPIIVLVSSAEFRNGPEGARPYIGFSPPARTFEESVAALNRIGARVVSVCVWYPPLFGSEPTPAPGRPHQETLARMTGAVDGSGNPLVFDAMNDGQVSDAIIEGIAGLAANTPQDVTTLTESVDGNPDGIDATRFIKAIVPVEGFTPDGAAGGYASKDDTTFYGVVPGTLVDFVVDFENDFVESPARARIYRAVIVVQGNGTARLGERRVFIVVPPEGGTVLI